MNFYCEQCTYKTLIKCNFDKHLLSKKHLGIKKEDKIKHKCDSCEYETYRKLNLVRHLETCKIKTKIDELKSKKEDSDKLILIDEIKNMKLERKILDLEKENLLLKTKMLEDYVKIIEGKDKIILEKDRFIEVIITSKNEDEDFFKSIVV